VAWDVVFMLLILKIPIIYLCVVIWWAIRAETGSEEPASLVPVEDTPLPWGSPRLGQGSRRGNGRPWHSGPSRRSDRAPRVATARKGQRS
jgi:hypothetical protein